MPDFKKYVEEFNANDEECYKNAIDNAHVLDWMNEEIPLFECPDKMLEKTYYFRWWTFRKHIKSTADGYMISEFLPDVPWGGKHNAIVAAVGHHLSEGRWLKNAEMYLKDYINFFFSHDDEALRYGNWLIWGAMEYNNITGKLDIPSFIEKAVPYYEKWAEIHKTETGLYWSIDSKDAMEYTISGTHGGKLTKGLRPTLNSYMYANARAIYELSLQSGNPLEEYREKAEFIKNKMNGILWREGFYKAVHPENEDFSKTAETETASYPRELLGYVPFCFGIADKSKENVFDLLGDEKVFLTNQGLATAEQSDRRFLFEVNHECLWNGYIWPFATSQTLNALLTSENPKYRKELFFKLLKQYAEQHTRVREDGKTVMWIDEVKAPYENVWTSREILKDWGWTERKGGYERGKDYNHSTFCDLVISGIGGISIDGDEVKFDPIIPEDWDYFAIERIHIKDKCYSIRYDKTGKKYGFTGIKIECI